MAPSPVVALNRAVAVSMGSASEGSGPAAALPLVEALDDLLTGWHRYHATRADVLRRLDRRAEALAEYERALAGVGSDPERRFLQRRIDELGGLP